jgi:hypothetical protein
VLDANETWISRQISEESSNIKFNQNLSSGSLAVPREQMYGRTDVTGLIVALRNFANAPNKNLQCKVYSRTAQHFVFKFFGVDHHRKYLRSFEMWCSKKDTEKKRESITYRHGGKRCPTYSKNIGFVTSCVGTVFWNKLYKVVQIWPGQTVTCLHTNRPGHIWTTL